MYFVWSLKRISVGFVIFSSVITRLSSSLSCKNFYVTYSKNTYGISTKLGILTHHNKVQLHEKGHNSESYSFGVMPLVNLNF